jgi:hypothetical protein
VSADFDGSVSEVRRRWRLRPDDGAAIAWAIACCWLAVGGNYLLITLRLGASWIVLFDMFAVPAIVSAAFWAARRARRR